MKSERMSTKGEIRCAEGVRKCVRRSNMFYFVAFVCIFSHPAHLERVKDERMSTQGKYTVTVVESGVFVLLHASMV